MGSALARTFLSQGYNTSVWNRTESKCEPLAHLGARIAPSVLDALTSLILSKFMREQMPESSEKVSIA